MPSQAQIRKLERERDSAKRSARKARDDKADAEVDLKKAKAAKREAVKEQWKAFFMLLLLSALSLTGGLVVGGQLTRIQDKETQSPSKWVSRGQWVAFILGLIVLVTARRGWHYVAAFLLLGIGGVKISDTSRMADLIPGTYAWEQQIPDGKTKIIVVEDPAANDA